MSACLWTLTVLKLWKRPMLAGWGDSSGNWRKGFMSSGVVMTGGLLRKAGTGPGRFTLPVVESQTRQLVIIITLIIIHHHFWQAYLRTYVFFPKNSTTPMFSKSQTSFSASFSSVEPHSPPTPLLSLRLLLTFLSVVAQQRWMPALEESSMMGRRAKLLKPHSWGAVDISLFSSSPSASLSPSTVFYPHFMVPYVVCLPLYPCTSTHSSISPSGSSFVHPHHHPFCYTLPISLPSRGLQAWSGENLSNLFSQDYAVLLYCCHFVMTVLLDLKRKTGHLSKQWEQKGYFSNSRGGTSHWQQEKR